MIGFILDIIVIAIIALFIFLGYKRGLVKVAISLIAFVIAIIITLILYKPVSKLIINNTQIDENIANTIYINIGIKDIEQESEFIEYLDKYTDENLGTSGEIILGNSVNELAQKIIEIGCMIVIYLVARVALIALSLLSGIITKLPLIKQFNELGGAVYGIFQGFLIVYTLLAVVFILASTSVNTDVINAIESSHLCNFMYSNNLILKVLF
jgi:ABC-type bacteriocin/lantibiotic exporter with double-glycine peptidase domain